MTKNIALVVLSCDSYSDLWPIFIKQFEKEWSNCPFDKYISTNFLSANSDSFKDIRIGEDNSWSDGVIKTLSRLKERYEYALITLEDLVLMEKVDNAEFTIMVETFKKLDGNYLKFIRKPRPTNKVNSLFGEIKPGSLYRPTCVYAIWKIETLLKLLVDAENAWQFERFGSIRSDKYDGFYVVYEDFFKVSNTVVKGKWVPKEKEKIEQLGYSIDSSKKTLSRIEATKLRLNTYIFNIFTRLIPWKYRRSIVFKIKGYARKYNNTNL
ncbi:MAG: hypothetical protein JXQ26_09735 [Tissierellales bacterium]|nr:hypothetical protein [Tissierellales bacterium]MBN2828262.1 hypothetical protein [Tissierellales bacterium]